MASRPPHLHHRPLSSGWGLLPASAGPSTPTPPEEKSQPQPDPWKRNPTTAPGSPQATRGPASCPSGPLQVRPNAQSPSPGTSARCQGQAVGSQHPHTDQAPHPSEGMRRQRLPTRSQHAGQAALASLAPSTEVWCLFRSSAWVFNTVGSGTKLGKKKKAKGEKKTRV